MLSLGASRLPPPAWFLDVSQIACVTCSPVHQLFNIQVTASTYTRILSSAMKENGKEGRHTVRNVRGLFPQQPAPGPVSSGSLGWAGGTGASCSGPSRSHCGRGKATSCSTGVREPRRPGAAPVARSKARQQRRGWSATFSQAAGPQAGTPPWALVPLCQSKSNGGDFTADP